MKNIILSILVLAATVGTAQDLHQGHKHEKKSEKAKNIDPVCKMKVAKNPSIKTEVNGKTIGFCSESCKSSFLKSPEKYLK